MDNQKLNGEFSNIDVEMEIISDLPENLSGLNIASLQSLETDFTKSQHSAF